MKPLEGNSVLVTGGASGLGRAIVDRFIAEGACVTVLDRNADALGALARDLGDRVATHAGDVRSLADNYRAVELATERFGGLDTFIGNAGIWDYSVALVDLPDDAIDAAFDEVFAVNTKGHLMGMKAAAPALFRSRGSAILTLSNAAFYPGGGGPLYTASKHASVGLVRQLAYELAPYVRVNAVAPGAIASDLRGPRALGQADQSIRTLPMDEYARSGTPLARLPGTDEYTGAYVLLASRHDGAPITGAIIQADGGLGVRGLSSVAGGRGLPARFGN
ncbi:MULTISPECIES: 3-(cis-5,6-dihydroxycyclohexa-1,3-dien-1-yl)propanoate dehydrogenase [Burkholderia]|uniref:3-(cis-5,6-dihydroxycyclohexa-1, 3-dien-1-yl)propanoate dehydrogenase n=1 Tax=Burkholderia TaxID=32008 RepID=UPI0006D8C7D9|nr:MULTISPECIES: 3-(cis-5,6-dihydroxycyclohexa-1,3-dien-1-yl)propanoate dehydrogenase [Burkholderia]ALK30085.1 Cis-2,3-dihydrobiphenyl-2,3-diol dehydrogenase [Burkholderia plantarii]GLZ23193.1 3-phenylpropionate-dihydrodiol/cinnamic acid-dihydrodiol dehydrogenase [Burkholderia plantarii]